MHVIKTEGVRSIGSYRNGTIVEPSRGNLTKRIITIEVRLVSGKFITICKHRSGSCPTRIFPLGLRGKSVHAPRCFFLGKLGKPATELPGVIPGDSINRKA